MKTIHYYIIAMMSLTMLSCSSSDDEPSVPVWPEGQVPLSLRAMEAPMSRVDFTSLDGTAYDIYTCGVYYGGNRFNGYYTPTEILNNGKREYYSVFSKMDFNPTDKLFYLSRFFYPMSAHMDLLSYGVSTGKKVEGYAYPEKPQRTSSADYMYLDLTGNYDGSFEVIAADRITVECSTQLQASDLPYGHYHHIQAYLNFKFKWADGVPSTAGLVSRLRIHGVRIEGTPCKGFCRIRQVAADAEWYDTSDEDAAVPGFTTSLIDHTNGLVAANGVYVIPQEHRHRIIVNYSIENDGGNTRIMNYVLSDDATKAWEAGHKYTYVISIGSTGNFSIQTLEVTPFGQGHVGNTVID